MLQRRSMSHRKGAVAVIVAVCLPVLLGVAVLAVDAGRLYRDRRNAQAAADTAAEAAGIELYKNYPLYRGVDTTGSARATALEIARLNGYDASQVTVNIPPASGQFQGQPGYAEVTITTPSVRAFSVIYGSNNVNVRARAVGAGTTMPTKASVLVLDPRRKDALKLKGKNSELKVAGDIAVNSTDKRAVKVSKKGQITADNLLVAGGIEKNSKRYIDATVSTGVDAATDPLADLPVPDKGVKRDLKDYKTTQNNRDIYDLPPGNYKELKFKDNEQVLLSPGTFYVDGEVSLRGSSSLVGDQVLIYSESKKGMKFHTDGEITLSPPKSGTYADITLFQNGASKTKIEFKNDRHLDISGVIYGPNSEVKFKNSDAEIDEDWDTESEEYFQEEDGGLAVTGSLGASIISRKLTIEKASKVELKGASINIQKPLRGLVE